MDGLKGSGGCKSMTRYKPPRGVKLGTGSYLAGPPRVLWNKYGNRVLVGKYTSISRNVTFFLGGHHRHRWLAMGPLGNKQSSYSKGHIVIGSDCWIGEGATVLDGVIIGDGVVIGAMAVVAKSIPPYAIVVGNPGTVVDYRFDPAIVRALLEIRWWNWRRSKIIQELPLLQTDDPLPFLEKHHPLGVACVTRLM